ncbi:MAG: aminotransferase class III-fold pyridoxal phosphate-dependent enzyme [Thiolinea sp.]
MISRMTAIRSAISAIFPPLGCTAGPVAVVVKWTSLSREPAGENATVQGDYLKQCLYGLMDKYEIIGDVRGKGLFAGFELVKDRQTKEPVPESVAAAITSHCMKNGVIIGRTNRSLPGMNNIICLSPALIVRREEIDQIVAALDAALAAL